MTEKHNERITGLKSFLTFTSYFFHYCHVLRWLLGLQFLLVLLGGMAFAHFETLDLLQGVYFSLITSTTVGFGDITPKTGLGQFISVLLAIMGTILFGLVVTVATQAFSVTIKEFRDAK